MTKELESFEGLIKPDLTDSISLGPLFTIGAEVKRVALALHEKEMKKYPERKVKPPYFASFALMDHGSQESLTEDELKIAGHSACLTCLSLISGLVPQVAQWMNPAFIELSVFDKTSEESDEFFSFLLAPRRAAIDRYTTRIFTNLAPSGEEGAERALSSDSEAEPEKDLFSNKVFRQYPFYIGGYNTGSHKTERLTQHKQTVIAAWYKTPVSSNDWANKELSDALEHFLANVPSDIARPAKYDNVFIDTAFVIPLARSGRGSEGDADEGEDGVETGGGLFIYGQRNDDKDPALAAAALAHAMNTSVMSRTLRASANANRSGAKGSAFHTLAAEFAGAMGLAIEEGNDDALRILASMYTTAVCCAIDKIQKDEVSLDDNALVAKFIPLLPDVEPKLIDEGLTADVVKTLAERYARPAAGGRLALDPKPEADHLVVLKDVRVEVSGGVIPWSSLGLVTTLQRAVLIAVLIIALKEALEHTARAHVKENGSSGELPIPVKVEIGRRHVVVRNWCPSPLDRARGLQQASLALLTGHIGDSWRVTGPERHDEHAVMKLERVD